jgi:hypothetical protein
MRGREVLELRPSMDFQTRSSNQAIFDAYTVGALTHNITYQKANGNDGNIGGNGNMEAAGSHYAIAHIAALDNTKQPTSYTTAGANLLVGNYAGYGGSSNSPGVCTISGSNTYTCNMNGTSAATPLTTGVVTLIKQAKMNAKWLDIHTILAMSADPISEAELGNCGLAQNCINYVVNGAGYRHSFKAGFGAVNASKAVVLAENFTSLPALEKYSTVKNSGTVPKVTGSKSIAANACSSYELNLSKDFQAYSLDLSFQFSGAIRDAGIFMTMPDGKKAQILRPSSVTGTSLTYSHFFKSMQAMGINVQGVWKFEACSKTAATFSGVTLDVLRLV